MIAGLGLAWSVRPETAKARVPALKPALNAA